MKTLILFVFLITGTPTLVFSQYGYTVAQFEIETKSGKSFPVYIECECSGLSPDSVTMDCHSSCLRNSIYHSSEPGSMFMFYRKSLHYKHFYLDSLTSDTLSYDFFDQLYDPGSIAVDSIHSTRYLSHYYALPFDYILNDIKDEDTLWMQSPLVSIYSFDISNLTNTVIVLYNHEHEKSIDSLVWDFQKLTELADKTFAEQMEKGRCCDSDAFYEKLRIVVKEARDLKVLIVDRSND